jgi:hypothetical protein
MTRKGLVLHRQGKVGLAGVEVPDTLGPTEILIGQRDGGGIVKLPAGSPAATQMEE